MTTAPLAIFSTLPDPLANSVPELVRVPLTTAVPLVVVSTIAAAPIVPPLMVSAVPLVASTSEPPAIVAPAMVLAVPLTVSITAPVPMLRSVPPETTAPSSWT